jgi:hypothetical protein
MEGAQVVKENVSNVAPLPRRVIPLPWEDLPSVISRVARKMGYERPEWILRPEVYSHHIAPNTLHLLRKRVDYLMLKRLLLLEEEQLFSLTLHRFTRRFEDLPSPLLQTNPDFLTSSERMLLPRYVQFFGSGSETQVCPLCLGNPDGYDRLYWRCSYVLLCARHRIYLVDHCPACRTPIPGLRAHPIRCPSCRVGDYRAGIVPLLDEDDWLEASQSLLLDQLGVEIAEIGGRVQTETPSPLQQISSGDYFWILSQFTQLFETPAFGYILPFLSRTLPFKTVLARIPSAVPRRSYMLIQCVLLHYLLAAWPAHVLVLLEQLQRALQDVFHCPEASGLLRQWKRVLVKGNCWCLTGYREQPRVALQPFFTACSRIEQLHPLTITEHSVEHGVGVLDRLLEPDPQHPTEQECVVPRPWEDLASVISRVARNRGDEYADWVLWFHDSSYRLSVDTIPVVARRADYQFLSHLLRLDEVMLYQLTLHRLAAALQPPGSTIRQRARFADALDIERPLLLATMLERFCLPLTTTKVCPACLDEQEGYDRLYWRLRPILICPRHALFLIDRCPRCALPIPALRISLTTCPHCDTGDYRTARRWSLSSDTLLSTGELFLLQRLGVDQVIGQGSSCPFANSPLSSMESWQCFQLLDLFGLVYRHLLPDRLFAYVGRKVGLHDMCTTPVPPEAKALARQISLFHALFLSWPQQCLILMGILEGIGHETVGAPGNYESIWPNEVVFESSGSGQADQGEIFAAFQKAFENLVRRALASVLTQQRSSLLVPDRRSFLRDIQISLQKQQA